MKETKLKGDTIQKKKQDAKEFINEVLEGQTTGEKEKILFALELVGSALELVDKKKIS